MTTAQTDQTIVEPIKRGEGEGNHRFSFGSNVMSSGEFLRRNLYNESPFKNLIRTPSSTSNGIETTQTVTKTFEDEFGSDDNEDNKDNDGDLQLDELIARTEQNFAYSKNLTVKIQDKLNLLNLLNDDLHQLMEEFDILLQSQKKESQEKERKVLNPLPTLQDGYDHHHEEQNQQQYHQRAERTPSSTDSLQPPQLHQYPKPLQYLHQNQQLQQHQPQFMNNNNHDHSEAEEEEEDDDDDEYDTSLEHNTHTPFEQQIQSKLNQIPSSFQAKGQVEEIFKTTINLIHGLQNEEIIQDQDSDEEEVMTEVMGRIEGNFERFVDSLR